MKEIGEDSAVQSSKWQGLTDFFPKLSANVDAQELLDSRIAYELRYVLQWMANADQLLLHRLHGGVEL